MEVDSVHAAKHFVRLIKQDAKDLRRDLASETVDSATVDGLLDRIEQRANLAETGLQAVAERLREIAG